MDDVRKEQFEIVAEQVERLKLLATDYLQQLRAAELPDDKYVVETYHKLEEHVHDVGTALYTGARPQQ